jgi:hypothetical protein
MNWPSLEMTPQTPEPSNRQTKHAVQFQYKTGLQIF